MRKPPRRHGNETLRRVGAYAMIVGLVAAFLPAPPADPFASVHELYEMAGRHIWWQFAGVAVLFLGNTLRLIGAQGHPGLPWPLFGAVGLHDAIARAELRRRARDNFVAALAGVSSPAAQSRWRLRLAVRRDARRRGVPLPRCLAERRRRASPAFAN